MSYKELQTALKTLRNQGLVDKSFRLNQRADVLQAEYDRVMAGQQEPQPEAVDELAAAKARIAELEAEVAIHKETIATMARLLKQPAAPVEETQAEPEVAEPTSETVTTEDEQVRQVIEANNNYASFEKIGQALNLEPKQLHTMLQALEERGLVELSAVAEPQEHSVDAVTKWSIPQFAGGSLYFAIWNETEAADNAEVNKKA